jgi:hypothetical protein
MKDVAENINEGRLSIETPPWMDFPVKRINVPVSHLTKEAYTVWHSGRRLEALNVGV